jgi:hypothetical protein
MSSTFTTNKSIEKPSAGSYNNTWATPVNADWDDIDNALGGNTAISVTAITAGTYALTLAQYQPPNIVFTGTLGANLVYVVPSGVGGTWSIFNNTTGAFTLTFGSSGGGSVTLQQGRRSLIVCDGTTVQFAQTAGSASANPSVTVGLTAKNGTAATFMTSDSAPALDQSIAPTWTGAHNFNGTMSINSAVGLGATVTMTGSGALNATAGTVTVATQSTGDNSTNAASTAFVKNQAYAPLASPALTGVPTVPTAASGTNTTQAASTAFVQAVLALGTLSTNGYLKIPVGADTWIIQWGIGTFLSTGSAVSFPITFPVACFMAICNAYGSAATAFTQSVSTTQITAVNGISGTNSWIAIGH